MISNLSPSSEAFLANIERVQRRVDTAGRQASSGKRVNVASDAPGELDMILQLRTDAERNEPDRREPCRGAQRCRRRR